MFTQRSRAMSEWMAIAVLATLAAGIGAIASPLPAAAVEVTRYCLAVHTDEPIEDADVLEAIAIGQATAVIEEVSSCLEFESGAALGPESLPAVGAPEAPRDTAARLLAELEVAPEARAGYDRDRFRHWVDDDRDGCNARREVLIDESLAPVRVVGTCQLRDGRWRSAFDGVETRDSSEFDVDHFVPLAEAWRSGAGEWNDRRRRAFANDLGDMRTLIAVSASSNRSKSDGDPARWLPPAADFHCTYVSDWVAVKTRWGLTVDTAERDAIASVLDGCAERIVEVVVVAEAAATTGETRRSTSPPARTATPAPTSRPGDKSSRCHRSYPGVCIAPPPPDLDCGDVPFKRFEVRGSDPHRFDGNDDGIGCQ
jgi:hypothetical protein